jgi:hypothetical protein
MQLTDAANEALAILEEIGVLLSPDSPPDEIVRVLEKVSEAYALLGAADITR